MSAERVRETEKRFVHDDPEQLTNLTPPTGHSGFIIPGALGVVAGAGVHRLPTAFAAPVPSLPAVVTAKPYPRGPPIA